MKISKTPSAPCWADLSTPDTDAARLFYQGLLGWRSEVVSGPRSEGYGLFRSGDELVAGIGPTRNPKEPSAWLPYYQSAGVDAVIARVKGNGGTVVTGPETIAEDGVFAVCQDPSGAAFGLWQPITNTGFGVVNAPGSFCWFELLTRDPDGSKDFYQSVLGWGAKRHPYGGGGTYTEWSVDTEPFGGMLDTASGSFPEDLAGALDGVHRRRGHRHDGGPLQGARRADPGAPDDDRAGPVRGARRSAGRLVRGHHVRPALRASIMGPCVLPA